MKKAYFLGTLFLLVCANAFSKAGDPPPPFGKKKGPPPDARVGVVEYSDGRLLVGPIYRGSTLPIRFYDRKRKKYFDLKLAKVRRLVSEIEREEIEGTWRWKEAGQDEKVYFGDYYPWRKYVVHVTLNNGFKLIGDISGALYINVGDKKVRFMLHKRQKGKLRSKMEDLIYVKSVDFSPEAVQAALEKLAKMKAAEDEAKQKAAASRPASKAASKPAPKSPRDAPSATRVEGK